MDAMAADALAFIADQGLEPPDRLRPLDGRARHAAGAHCTTRPSPAALVVVDVGPELSAKGTKVIGDFITHNVEFDDLDVFVENVARYDRFRTREHIARTVKYNMLQRADGKYVSKVDHRRLPGGDAHDHARQRRRHHVPGARWCAAASPTCCEPDAAERFVAALPDGRLVTVPGRRPQRARRQHARLPRRRGPVPRAPSTPPPPEQLALRRAIIRDTHLIAHAERQRWLSAASVTGSPAMRVCHILRGSVMSNGVARCIRRRLSQITVSPTSHSWW